MRFQEHAHKIHMHTYRQTQIVPTNVAGGAARQSLAPSLLIAKLGP